MDDPTTRSDGARFTGVGEMLRAFGRQQDDLARRLKPLIGSRGDLLRDWRPTRTPFAAVGERLQSIGASLAFSDEMRERLAWMQRDAARSDAMAAAGWMAHPSSPFHLVDEGLEGGELVQAVGMHYRDNWDGIATAMRTRVDACSVDEEAKATFAEALAAHGAGLFRCAPRLLFPEVERVARKELHGGAMDKMASQRGLQEAIGNLTPVQIDWSGLAGLRFYTKLTEHVYASLPTHEAVEAARADPVPNRHAAIHGYVSYAAPNTSFNALAGAEYLLLAISVIRDAAAEAGAA